MNHPMVCVKWADAHCGTGGWLELDDYEDDGEYIISTVGYLIPADAPGGKKNHVTIWQTLNHGEGIHPFHIPADMVRSISILSEGT